MSSGTLVIEDSLRLIGKHSIFKNDDPDSIQLGMRILNGMRADWEGQGINLNMKNLKNPGDPLDEPEEAYNAIISNLAVLMAPNYGNGKVTPGLARNARLGFMFVKNKFQKLTIPRKVVSSNLPVGEGNSAGIYRKTFFNKGQTIGN